MKQEESKNWWSSFNKDESQSPKNIIMEDKIKEFIENILEHDRIRPFDKNLIHGLLLQAIQFGSQLTAERAKEKVEKGIKDYADGLDYNDGLKFGIQAIEQSIIK